MDISNLFMGRMYINIYYIDIYKYIIYIYIYTYQYIYIYTLDYVSMYMYNDAGPDGKNLLEIPWGPRFC